MQNFAIVIGCFIYLFGVIIVLYYTNNKLNIKKSLKNEIANIKNKGTNISI
jgi:hypothetical protein